VPATSTSEPQPTPIPTGPTALFGRGQVLDNTYRIVDVLAAGGMGEVYVAVHLRLPRKLAIKTLQPEFAARQEWVARFCREACVLAQLHHPNIVQVIDFNVTPNGVPYIAMELIDGVDLRAELDRGRRFEVTEIVSIVRQVASALDAAHTAGVVHRDLKPENVVLTPAAGQLPIVKVIDFGVSLCDWSERVTGDCSVFGTPDYMAPEQARGLRDQTDARTDQFALAALTYTLLSGRAPFARETPVAILYAVVHEEPAALGTVEGWDPAPVERVLKKGMARERDDRYASVLAFAEALEGALVEGGALPRPAPPVPLMLVTSDTRAPSTARARRSTGGAVRRGIPMLLASLLIAGALWRGLGGTHTPEGERRALRADVGAVQAAATKGLQQLKGMLEQQNANGSQGEKP
jgi:serine/threonine protein kinase